MQEVGWESGEAPSTTGNKYMAPFSTVITQGVSWPVTNN